MEETSSDNNENQFQIISVNKNHMLSFDREKFNSLIQCTINKLIVIGAVGKMRTGKSTALNNFYFILTGKDTRPFSELESVETNTRGIHVIHIKFEEITQDMQEMILNNFDEKIDVILLDCEGTESSDSIGTSKLYLLNLLMNSAIHIHVSKSIDINFATKLSEALISSNQIIKTLNNDLKEILPALYILIKDTNVKAWENARKQDSSLNKYEDLLKKYKNLPEYIKEFPYNKTSIIAPPNTTNDEYIVNDVKSTYFKSLKEIFLESLKHKKLKSRDELLGFIESVTKAINEDNLMNVKSELEIFCKEMFNKQKNNLLIKIIQECSRELASIDHSPDIIKEKLKAISIFEVENFLKSVENISCKWIYNELKDELSIEIQKIYDKLVLLFEKVKNQYLIEREMTKQIENIYEDREITNETTEVNKKHGKFIYACKLCLKDKNSKGCKTKVETRIEEGNIFGKIFTLGIGFRDKERVSIKYEHGPFGEICSDCGKDNKNPKCKFDIIKGEKKSTERVLTGFNLRYTREDWNNKKFDAASFLDECIKIYTNIDK